MPDSQEDPNGMVIARVRPGNSYGGITHPSTVTVPRSELAAVPTCLELWDEAAQRAEQDRIEAAARTKQTFTAAEVAAMQEDRMALYERCLELDGQLKLAQQTIADKNDEITALTGAVALARGEAKDLREQVNALQLAASAPPAPAPAAAPAPVDAPPPAAPSAEEPKMGAKGKAKGKDGAS